MSFLIAYEGNYGLVDVKLECIESAMSENILANKALVVSFQLLKVTLSTK